MTHNDSKWLTMTHNDSQWHWELALPKAQLVGVVPVESWIHHGTPGPRSHLQSEDVLRFIQLYLLQVEHVSGRKSAIAPSVTSTWQNVDQSIQIGIWGMAYKQAWNMATLIVPALSTVTLIFPTVDICQDRG